MRGFFLGALVLVGLDFVLHQPTSRFAQTFVTPTRWLAEWMDARTPLITAPVPPSSSGSGSADLPAGLGGSAPAGSNPGQQMGNGETYWEQHGQKNNCPPGFPAGDTCEGM